MVERQRVVVVGAGAAGSTAAAAVKRGAPDLDGVPVDAQMRVPGQPRFYAAGDLAAVPGPDGTPARIEHWGAAMAQGRSAAASVLADLGRTEQPRAGTSVEVPSYSTYVHGTKITIIGWADAAVAEAIVHGAVGEQRFTISPRSTPRCGLSRDRREDPTHRRAADRAMARRARGPHRRRPVLCAKGAALIQGPVRT